MLILRVLRRARDSYKDTLAEKPGRRRVVQKNNDNNIHYAVKTIYEWSSVVHFYGC